MIQPEEIREKAIRLYPSFLKAWIEGDTAFFPHPIPSNKRLDSGRLSQSAQEVQRLRDGSRDVLGYGYTIQWEERRSRDFGLNQFPVRIAFETQDDFLRFIGKQSEFRLLSDAVSRLRSEYPTLADWVRSNRQLFIECAGELEGLLRVVRYFVENPRPNRFARELPIAVDTKFIERNDRILRQWLDMLLQPDAIRASESHFGRRYGLRYPEPHWLIRFLDSDLQNKAGFPCSELSIPLREIATLQLSSACVIVVENKVNLLTLPHIRNTLALGGVGRAITELRAVDWLHHVPITYWGDIDIDGLQILSAWRVIFPQTQSLFMDADSLARFGLPSSRNVDPISEVPPHLTDSERTAFVRCCSDNVWLEQERIPQSEVLLAIGRRFQYVSDGSRGDDPTDSKTAIASQEINEQSRISNYA